MTGLESLRKYSIEFSLRDHLDQLNGQLKHLNENHSIHHVKRKKLLLQLERRNNQLRRSIERHDQEKQTILIENNNLIRMIKRKIIQDEQYEQQQRQEEQVQDRYWWSPGRLMIVVGLGVPIGLILATWILMILNQMNEDRI